MTRYTGYMVNWIAGQPFAKKPKAFVCHDSIFDTLNLVSGDVATATHFDTGEQILGASPSALEKWDRCSPSRHTTNWTQPMLFIHYDDDFRCPILKD